MNNEELTVLMHIIPDNDENCDLKRAEIARWYKVYGKKILYPLDMDKVMNVLTILMVDNHSWNHNRLNNLTLGKNLLKRIDIQQIGHNLTSHLHSFACLLCLEDDIRTLFYKLDESNKSYKEGWTTEEFVSDILSRSHYGPLVKFWSHYINVVGVENPSPIIVSSFRKILSEYSEGFDVNNIDDTWKCGFECAKKEGSREALEFFWNKIQNKYNQEEQERILLDIGVNAHRLCSYNEDNNFNLVEFSLHHLGSEKYKDFVIKDYEINEWPYTIPILISNCLYSEAKKMIYFLNHDAISYEEYESALIHDALKETHKLPCKLRNHSLEFFSWLWNFEKFERHKQYCLNDSEYILHGLLDVDVKETTILIDHLKLILDSASPDQIRKICYGNYGLQLCGILYVSNRDLLQKKILNNFQHIDNIMTYVDNTVLLRLNECDKLKDINAIFDLYKQGQAEELMMVIQHNLTNKENPTDWLGDIVCDALGKIIVDDEIDSDHDVLSQVNDLELEELSHKVIKHI